MPNPATAPAAETPRISVQNVSEPFRLDGRFDEPFWKDIPIHSDFRMIGRHRPVSTPLGSTSFQIALHDESTLLIGIRCQQPVEDLLVRTKERGNSSVCADDSVEVFVSPGEHGFYQFAVNAEGYVFDRWAAPADGGTGPWTGVWETAVFRGEDEWSVEIAIPLTALNQHREASPSVWRLNIGRTWGRERIFQSWAPVKTGYADVEHHGTMEFNPPLSLPLALSADPVEFPDLRIGQNEFVIETAAPAHATYFLKTSLRHWQPGPLPEREIDARQITASAEGVLRIPVEVFVKDEQALYELVIELVDATRSETVCLFAHTFRAPRLLGASIPWTVYFPGDGHVQVSATLRAASTSSLKGEFHIAVTDLEAATVYENRQSLDGREAYDFSIPLAGLKTGIYEITIQADLDAIGEKNWNHSFLFVPGPFDFADKTSASTPATQPET